MKILAINGSHRVGENTSKLLQMALDEAAALGAETELVDLAELDIEFCVGCNKCLFKPVCSLNDDMDELKQKMLDADGTHEMLIVHPRPEGPVIASGITGSLMAGMQDGKPRWRRSVEEDPIAPKLAHQLGKDMVELIQKLQG